MVTAKNPILSGFYPDPSICAVENDFYLVTSTFAYFPGVPVFHSRDLAHWEQIGHALNRTSQLMLEGCDHSEGIFAPTIRCYEGTFYIITTNVSGGGNFVVTAKDPAGEWSEPYYLDAPGIDPSLFFDDDGTCYYVGTRPDTHGPRYAGDWEIWCQKLDLDRMQLAGESHVLWKGAQRETVWPEGPHLYKKDGYYYLMIAEGGTGREHCITIARSREVFGEYEGCPRNPILTHRHLGEAYPVACVGHGDLVQDSLGNWFMVMLATRPCKGHTNLGRETFLAKVVWENGWPVVNPEVGRLERTVHYPGKAAPVALRPVRYDFVDDKLPMEFLTLRGRRKEAFSLTACPGALRLYLLRETLSEQKSPAYIGVRQLHQDYQASVKMRFCPKDGEESGLAVVQSNRYHVRFVIRNFEGKTMISVISCEDGCDRTIANRIISESTMEMYIENRGQEACFYYKTVGDRVLVAEMVDMKHLSTETAGGFVGCTIGMYASSNGTESRGSSDFLWFAYRGLFENEC